MLKNNLPKDVNLLLNGKFDLRKGLWEIEEIMRDLTVQLDREEEEEKESIIAQTPYQR